jgi:uncharacterized membrane protein
MLLPAAMIRPSIVEHIVQAFPAWSPEGFICLDDLNRFRSAYVQSLLREEKGELTSLERSVVESLADHIADFGGSWTFILLFAGVILFWVLLNAVFLLGRTFDPYPFILLNLLLSCLAAIQAPIIMMSQNRQEARDRLRSENDYRVNLKAELEIRHLHEKLDHLLQHQWERLAEIQQIQIELVDARRSRG